MGHQFRRGDREEHGDHGADPDRPQREAALLVRRLRDGRFPDARGGDGEQAADHRDTAHGEPGFQDRVDQRQVVEPLPRAGEAGILFRHHDLDAHGQHRHHVRGDRERAGYDVAPQPDRQYHGQHDQRPAEERVLLGAVERNLRGCRLHTGDRLSREAGERRGVVAVRAVQQRMEALRAEKLPVQRESRDQRGHRDGDGETLAERAEHAADLRAPRDEIRDHEHQERQRENHQRFFAEQDLPGDQHAEDDPVADRAFAARDLDDLQRDERQHEQHHEVGVRAAVRDHRRREPAEGAADRRADAVLREVARKHPVPGGRRAGQPGGEHDRPGERGAEGERDRRQGDVQTEHRRVRGHVHAVREVLQVRGERVLEVHNGLRDDRGVPLPLALVGRTVPEVPALEVEPEAVVEQDREKQERARDRGVLPRPASRTLRGVVLRVRRQKLGHGFGLQAHGSTTLARK